MSQQRGKGDAEVNALAPDEMQMHNLKKKEKKKFKCDL